MSRIIILVLLCSFSGLVSTCDGPDKDSTLKPWSASSTWTDKGLPVPTTDSVVDIQNGMDVLLDADIDVYSITISDGGRLVWSSARENKVRTNYIYIKGTMEIGSESCPFTTKTEITLKGIRGQYTIPNCGEKFICVDNGGTLELHGENKLAWTKLENTVNKLGDDAIFFQHSKSPNYKTKIQHQGFIVFVFDPTTLAVEKQDIFYLSGNRAYYTNIGLNTFGPFIDSIEDGKVVGMALQRQLVGSSDLSTVYDIMEKLTGSSLIRKAAIGDAYAMITIKGDPSSTVEVLDNVSETRKMAKAAKDFWDANRKLEMYSQIQLGSWTNTIVDATVYDLSKVYPIIDIADNGKTWHDGDKIVFMSTDFSWQQTEEATVLDCPSCGPKQIRVDFVPKYVHFGKVLNNVDMRGEVALLTRNIKIKGEMASDYCPQSNGNCNDYDYDTFGGHIKFLRYFKDVHVEGVELEHMGQQTSLGNYPLHFHMCHGTADYTNPPYLRKNSVHHSFARCITIHGTHDITVMDNVCYDHLGHGIFLEDGGEKNTVIDGNLVAITRKASLIPSDSQPTSFWITNPNTRLLNNVAAGSEALGFWFIFPRLPLEPSRKENFMAYDEARYTPVTEIKNNLGHSNFRFCFLFEGDLDDKGNIIKTIRYTPKVNPFDINSEGAPVYIDQQTCYKNYHRNMWIRGGYFVIRQYSSSDCADGLRMARNSRQEQFIEDSVFVGESDNIGEPTKVWNRELRKYLYYPRHLVIPWAPDHPIQGYVVYDGPCYADNIWFGGFKSTENYTSAAIGFQKKNKAFSSPVSAMTNMQFGFNDPAGGNRVYDGDESVPWFGNLDGDKGATIRDEDGSIAGTNLFRQIVKPGDFYTTPLCKYRTNWNMALCPYKYGKLDVIVASKGDLDKTYSVMVRDDDPSASEELHRKDTGMFATILGGSHSYTLHWTNQVPEEIQINSYGIEKDLHVRLGICLPKDATFDLIMYLPTYRASKSAWTEVNSIAELDSADLGDRYFWDASAGLLFIKFLTNEARTEDTTENCGGYCPRIKVIVLTGDRSKGDCQHTAYTNPGNYKKPFKGKMTDTMDDNIPLTSAAPPVNWGAGPQVPFKSRLLTDGGFSAWSEWSTCSVDCGDGTQQRTRLCNNPLPANGGADCSGSYVETRQCQKPPCVINGGFSDWTSWTQCFISDGCQGYKTKERSCDNPKPANGGLFCTGELKMQEACNNCS